MKIQTCRPEALTRIIDLSLHYYNNHLVITTKIPQKIQTLPGHASLWGFPSDCAGAWPVFSEHTQQETHCDLANQREKTGVCGSHSWGRSDSSRRAKAKAADGTSVSAEAASQGEADLIRPMQHFKGDMKKESTCFPLQTLAFAPTCACVLV